MYKSCRNKSLGASGKKGIDRSVNKEILTCQDFRRLRSYINLFNKRNIGKEVKIKMSFGYNLFNTVFIKAKKFDYHR